MKRSFLFIYAIILFQITVPLWAKDYFVSPYGDDGNDGTIEYPWRTIAHAMSMISGSSSQSHNLMVASGFYDENFTFKEYVNVYGGFQPQLWHRQIDYYPTFLKKADNTPFALKNNMILDGFIIYAGLQCINSSPGIENCRIMLSEYDGILCSYNSAPHIVNCSIKQCLGHGINIFSGASPLIENTVVAMCGGDGINISGNSHPNLFHVTVAHNLFAGVRLEDTSSVTIDNSIIWENGDDLVNCHAIHSCVSEGDFYYQGNSTDDPLFVGWSGYNENLPLYVATTGSDLGTGDVQSPMKHMRQAMAYYRYHLSMNSPYINHASDGKDTGAYPEPPGYDPYWGNTGKILVLPGDYFETGIVVSVPVYITGIQGYIPTLSLGNKNGFLWSTTGGISSFFINGGNIGINQLDGDISIKDSTFTGALEYGFLSESGNSSFENVVVQNCPCGVKLSGGSPLINNCLFTNNSLGVSCNGNSAPQVIQSQFISNTTGISCGDDSMPNIRQSIFSGNTEYGVLAMGQSFVTIAMNRFEYNSVGVYSWERAHVEIIGNFIHDNTSRGLDIASTSTMKIFNNTICYNQMGVSSYDPLSVDIQNCIIRDNSMTSLDNCNARYSNISGGAPGEGNFDMDPLFTDAGQRDLHLSENSPCIDAGRDWGIFFRDFDEEPRPMGEGIDVGADEFPETWKYTFTKNAQDWRTLSIPNVFTPPLFDSTGGFLTLRCTDSKTYGAWESPPGAIIMDNGKMYRIRFRVRGNTTNLSQSPGLRFRINSLDTQWIDEFDVFSLGQGVASPPQQGRNYDMYMIPPVRNPLYPKEREDLSLSMDLVNFDIHDESQASLYLEDVIIESIPTTSLLPEMLEKRYEFNLGSEGWTTGGAEPLYTEPYFYVQESFLKMQAKNNWNCYGYWETLVPGFQLKPNLLYRVEYVMRSDVSSDLVPTLRIRMFTQDGALTYMRVINSAADASVTLTGQNREFSYYFVPLEEYSTGDTRGLQLALDMINFNLKDERRATILLERVSIYSSNLPVFP